MGGSNCFQMLIYCDGDESNSDQDNMHHSYATHRVTRPNGYCWQCPQHAMTFKNIAINDQST